MIVIFELEDGLILALYPTSELAKDAGLDGGSTGSGWFSLDHLVGGRDEADALLARAAAAGAKLSGTPHDRPWGIYSGYFADPDGHLWEVIWNPDNS